MRTGCTKDGHPLKSPANGAQELPRLSLNGSKYNDVERSVAYMVNEQHRIIPVLQSGLKDLSRGTFITELRMVYYHEHYLLHV